MVYKECAQQAGKITLCASFEPANLLTPRGGRLFRAGFTAVRPRTQYSKLRFGEFNPDHRGADCASLAAHNMSFLVVSNLHIAMDLRHGEPVLVCPILGAPEIKPTSLPTSFQTCQQKLPMVCAVTRFVYTSR